MNDQALTPHPRYQGWKWTQTASYSFGRREPPRERSAAELAAELYAGKPLLFDLWSWQRENIKR